MKGVEGGTPGGSTLGKIRIVREILGVPGRVYDLADRIGL